MRPLFGSTFFRNLTRQVGTNLAATTQPQIILLKEGTDVSQGKAQLISYFNTCIAVVDVVRTTLGPRGMDKLVHDDKGTTISNDGATIMKLLDIVHPAAPAAKILVDIAKSQDSEVGDGTTMVVLLAGELLREAKPFVEDGVHPQLIVRAFRTAANLVVKKVNEFAVSIEGKSTEEKKSLLEKCASTTLSSKLDGGEKEFFAKMVVDAVASLGADSRLNMIGIKKVQGGTMQDSSLVKGVAFKKTFSYAGFEQRPKSFKTPTILLLNLELELKSEKENAEVRLSDPSQYQSIVDAEWNIIYDKLDKCVQSGAKIVLSRLAIGDLATQYFADRDVFCAGRVMEEDLQRVAVATGASVQTTVNNVIPDVLGQCELFEERQVGNERFNIFTGCPGGETATIVLRGGADQFIGEAERSLHDAIMIVRRALKNSNVVAGGGAIDMELSQYLLEHARTIAGKSHLFINSYAKALEVIPRQLCDNAGFDATDVLNKLRQKQALASGEGALYGVDINTGGIVDKSGNFAWEPSVVKVEFSRNLGQHAQIVIGKSQRFVNPYENVLGHLPRASRYFSLKLQRTVFSTATMDTPHDVGFVIFDRLNALEEELKALKIDREVDFKILQEGMNRLKFELKVLEEKALMDARLWGPQFISSVVGEFLRYCLWTLEAKSFHKQFTKAVASQKRVDLRQIQLVAELINIDQHDLVLRCNTIMDSGNYYAYIPIPLLPSKLKDAYALFERYPILKMELPNEWIIVNGSDAFIHAFQMSFKPI